jgi:hypothetical protein
MNGLTFHRQATINDTPELRTDIACFAGLINIRAGKTWTPEIADWLLAHSWITEKDVGQPLIVDSSSLNIPIPIENWAVFDGLFQWESRTTDGSGGPTYLGMAVRAFFAQGGQKCYVLPIAPSDTQGAIAKSQDGLRAKYLAQPASEEERSSWKPASEQDRSTWKGVTALFGLEDVSFLLLPDLPELVRSTEAPPPVAPPPAPKVEEHFTVCDESAVQSADPDSVLTNTSAPRCDQKQYGKWTAFLQQVQQLFLGTRAGQTLQVIAALPLPLDAGSFGGTGKDLMSILPGDQNLGYSFAEGFFQISYPWLSVDAASSLPEQLLPPDSVLVGILARNALTRGTFRDATRVTPNQLYDVSPHLSKNNYVVPEAPLFIGSGTVAPPLTPVQRISLFGPTPSGYRLMSDVTTSTDPVFRFAPVRRLISALVSAARSSGQSQMFESNGPRLWDRIRRSLEALLTRFWQANALNGETAADAFSVRCDRSTMSQADLDAGRAIVEITLKPAVSIEEIRVTLAVSSGNVLVEGTSALASAAEVA